MSDDLTAESATLGLLPDVVVAEQPHEPTPEPVRPTRLDDAGLDLMFRTARTSWAWTNQPVDDEQIRTLYDTLRWGPTSGNCSPARFMFLRSGEAKERLRPTLSGGNLERTMAAPLVCIVAHDPSFYEQLPRLWPHGNARAWYADNYALANETAFRNGTLQGAYLILAARALGLDAGPMSGFDNGRVDSEFLLSMGWKSNFLVCLGHGDGAMAPPRDPRLEFAEACRLL